MVQQQTHFYVHLTDRTTTPLMENFLEALPEKCEKHQVLKEWKDGKGMLRVHNFSIVSSSVKLQIEYKIKTLIFLISCYVVIVCR